MADIVENTDAPVIEKEVEENDVPKVVEADEKLVENGKAEEEKAAVPAKNGDVPAVDEDEDESKDGDEEKNGDSTDAPTSEAVKRKVESSVDGVEESAETPEKKSKLADENIATVEAEATA